MRETLISEEKNGVYSTISAVGWHVCAQDLMQREPVFLRTYSTYQQTMEVFLQERMSSLLVAVNNPLDGSLRLSGRVSLKDVFRQIFLCLVQKDLINLNQVLHRPIDNILISSQPTVNLKSDILEVLSVMLNDFPYVMGVVNQGELVGQISYMDLAVLFKPIDGKDSPAIQLIQQVLPESARVSRAMARHVLCLSPRDEISKVMGILMATDTPGIPVLDEQGNLKSIISRMEVLEYILNLLGSTQLALFDQKGLILDRTIGSFIEKEIATISAADNLATAVKKMIEKNIFCLAVTDVHRRFCGLLSITDIMSWVYTHLKEQAS